MITKTQLWIGTGCDPQENLAVEQALLEATDAGCCTLYLWQNQNTVVIGKNQNAWKECRTALLEQEGGKLARRLSGGGAVYHDLGNLNFTFLLPTEDFDLSRQFSVLQRALLRLGIPAELSGRNDLTADGQKFSGNAFYHHAGRSYHHGTLLVSADLDRMSRYLRPSAAKLKAKGVDSVRSRVTNLCALRETLTVAKLQTALIDAFTEVYGSVPTFAAPDPEAVARLTARNRSWEWNYGAQLPFDFSCGDRFPWGEVQIELKVDGGTVTRAKVYTDAMDWTLAPALEAALIGSRFSAAALCERIAACGMEQTDDLCGLIRRQDV